MPVAEPDWLDGDRLLADMAESVVGLHLVRAPAFQAALAAPQMAFAYGGICEVHHLAAIYAYRIAKAHALLDGNKRTAITAALTFLALNGSICRFNGEEADDALIALTTDDWTETQFADYLQTHSETII